MKVKVLLFGQLKETLNAEFIEIDGVDNSDILMTKLKSEHPKLTAISFRIAVDKNLVSEKVVLNDTSEVALLPPFSGG